MHYGIDIAARRVDDLDRKLLVELAADVARGQQPTVLDLGCGSGGLAVRLAALGAIVTAVDIADYQADIAERNTTLLPAAPPIRFIRDNALHFIKTDTSLYGSIVMQRVLHYLPPAEVLPLLRQLRSRTQRLYVSVTGVESDIGRTHPVTHNPLSDHFATLPVEAQRTFSISAPLCVYSADELQQLLVTAGWQVNELWTSAFGNHKAVAAPVCD